MASTTTIVFSSLAAVENTAWYTNPGWFEAIATITAVVVSLLFGLGLIGWKPKIEVSLDDPRCFRTTALRSGERGHWIRLKVTNIGNPTAQKCYGMITNILDQKGEMRDDKDPMILRWAGFPQELRQKTVIDGPVESVSEVQSIPEMKGFEPLQLAKNQCAFLNVLCILDNTKRSNPIRIVTYQDCDFGFDPGLELGREHIICISIFAENASPKQVKLSLNYSGEFKKEKGKLKDPDVKLIC